MIQRLFLLLLFSVSSQAAIYGRDDRQGIAQVPQYREIAKAVAVAVGHNLLIPNGDGTTRVDLVDRLGDFACADQRFLNQASLGICTGFLISDRYLVTAGHCDLPAGISDNANDPFCQAFDWYFDYTADAAGATDDQQIPADKLYRCKRVVRAENIEATGNISASVGNDFAIIELDRAVVSSIQPLRLAANPVQAGGNVYTIGHPTGLPAKFSGFAKIIDNSQALFFATNLDTEGGNSGGPVFNAQNEVVGILVSGHPVDYHTDDKLRCDRVNVCDEQGLNCSENSTFPWLQTANYVQRISTLRNYLPPAASPSKNQTRSANIGLGELCLSH